MSKPPKKYALIGTSCVGKTTLLSQMKEVKNMVEKQSISHAGDNQQQPKDLSGKIPSTKVCEAMPQGLRIGVTFVAPKPGLTDQDVVNQQQLVEAILSHKS